MSTRDTRLQCRFEREQVRIRDERLRQAAAANPDLSLVDLAERFAISVDTVARKLGRAEAHRRNAPLLTRDDARRAQAPWGKW